MPCATPCHGAYLAPLEAQLVHKHDAVALCDGKPSAVRAEAEPPDDVVLGTLVCGFRGEFVSFFAVLVV